MIARSQPVEKGDLSFPACNLIIQMLFRRTAFAIMHQEDHSWITRMRFTRLLAILPVSLSMFLTACVPVRVPKQVQPVSGGDQGRKPDTSAIRVGITTRAMITQQFGAFDTGWKGERLFLGRWLSAGGIAIVGMYSDFNYGGGGWVAHDLVVEFDEKGKVIRYQLFSDKHFLDDLPRLLSTEGSPPEIQQPTIGTSFETVNVMGKEFLELSGKERWWGTTDVSWSSRITREQLERLSSWPTPLSANEFGLTIHLREKVKQEFQESNGKSGTRRTKNLYFRADVPTIALLVQFLHMPSAKP